MPDSGYDTVLISLRNRPSVHSKLFGDLAGLSQRVDGILLLNIALSEAEMAAVDASGLAVASVGMHDVPWDNVGIDNEEAARAATDTCWTWATGTWPCFPAAKPGEPSLVTANERLRGFEQALAEHDLTVDPDLVLEAGSSIEGGRLAMTELIENRRMPSAIFAGCDETAFGALMALRDHGLSAPKNMSIIGIDDHQMSWFLGLSTIAQPVADQGAFAANLLIERLHRSGLPNPRPATAGDQTDRAQEHPPPTLTSARPRRSGPPARRHRPAAVPSAPTRRDFDHRPACPPSERT